jgi:hypothetical protein
MFWQDVGVAAANNITALVDNAVADGPDIQEEVMFPRHAPSLFSVETLSLTQYQTLFAAYLFGYFAVHTRLRCLDIH